MPAVPWVKPLSWTDWELILCMRIKVIEGNLRRDLRSTHNLNTGAGSATQGHVGFSEAGLLNQVSALKELTCFTWDQVSVRYPFFSVLRKMTLVWNAHNERFVRHSHKWSGWDLSEQRSALKDQHLPRWWCSFCLSILHAIGAVLLYLNLYVSQVSTCTQFLLHYFYGENCFTLYYIVNHHPSQEWILGGCCDMPLFTYRAMESYKTILTSFCIPGANHN